MADFRQTIARKLANGPLYMRSFQQVKVQVAAMVAAGEVERVAPPQNRARNMVALTAAGRARYKIAGAD